MPGAKLLDLFRSWVLALGLSAALVAAGDRWPGALPIQPAVVWSLVCIPPGLMALVLVLRWRLPPQEAASAEGGESVD